MELESIIGLEIHVQMNTKTKMFCSCDNDSFTKKPNINVCPVCMGFPGMLPYLNKEVLKKGLLSALALNLEIPEFSKFDRKQYFYPDNPKGFQISQFKYPISKDGYLEILNSEGETRKIGITRLHIEDDAGKLTHKSDGTFLDFNRAGTPLMEIVSEPDLRSANEAKLYAEKIQNIIRFVGTSTCDMEKGMMRFDASVSLRPKGDSKLYARTEIKNLNSFKFLEDAINYEIKRQTELWESGNPQTKETTAGWVGKLNKTEIMREKEAASDYRYFPEPDLPPLEIKKEYIETLRNLLPEMPEDKQKRYVKELGIKMEDAKILTEDKALAEFFEETADISKNPKLSSNWILSTLLAYLKEEQTNVQNVKIKPKDLAEMIKFIDSGDISSKIAKDIFDNMYKTGESAKNIIDKKGLKQMSDTSEIKQICQVVIDSLPEVIADIKSGRDKAFGRLVGEVMKRTQGKANPGLANKYLKEIIDYKL